VTPAIPAAWQNTRGFGRRFCLFGFPASLLKLLQRRLY
jgi:hypothetical protein